MSDIIFTTGELSILYNHQQIFQHMAQEPALFGLRNSNRDFTSPYAWGKNQFNSAFPAALACFMRVNKIPAVYVKYDGGSHTSLSEISFDDFWKTNLENEKLKFLFEYRYTPYSQLTLDDIQPIDLVVADNNTALLLSPVEIKLTTIPDNTTLNDSEDKYGSELVIRSPTMRYVAMGIGKSCENHMTSIRDIFSPSCQKIRNWDSMAEVFQSKDAIIAALSYFLEAYNNYETPLLMQPIWKTKGKNPILADNCLDIFVWSDFAICKMLIDSSMSSDEKIPRPQRAALRLARFLYELSTKGKVFQKPIYDGMTYDNLNDKEFAISGKRTNSYMRCPRLTTPIIERSSIKDIIIGGGQRFLSPERRFDAIIYYSVELFDEI